MLYFVELSKITSPRRSMDYRKEVVATTYVSDLSCPDYDYVTAALARLPDSVRQNVSSYRVYEMAVRRGKLHPELITCGNDHHAMRRFYTKD